MADLNVVALVGNLTRDPDVKASNDEGGPSVVALRVANNQRAKVDGEWTEKANYFDVTVFGQQARFVSQYGTKGRQVSVHGRLDFREWEQEGNKRNAVQIIANDVSFVGKREDAPAETPAEAAPDSWDS